MLRDGETTLQGAPMAEMTRDRLVEAMIGRAEQVIRPRSRQRSDDVPKLEMSALATAAGHRDLSLTLHRGEVLGLYGLVGADGPSWRGSSSAPTSCCRADSN